MKVIVVAGMHRSGTSLVARTLNLLGADLGPSSSLLPAAPDNPSGFWEHRDVKELNDRLLASLGGTWDAPPPLPAGWQDSRDLNPVRSLAAAIVAQFSDSDVVLEGSAVLSDSSLLANGNSSRRGRSVSAVAAGCCSVAGNLERARGGGLGRLVASLHPERMVRQS